MNISIPRSKPQVEESKLMTPNSVYNLSGEHIFHDSTHCIFITFSSNQRLFEVIEIDSYDAKLF